jgi:hypothetical protein
MSGAPKPITEYRFGILTIKVQGLGVYCGHDRLRVLMADWSAEKLQAVNKEAWKQRRHAARLCDRYSNVTIHGCGPHDRASQHFDVADAVCKATWERLCQQREAV